MCLMSLFMCDITGQFLFQISFYQFFSYIKAQTIKTGIEVLVRRKINSLANELIAKYTLVAETTEYFPPFCIQHWSPAIRRDKWFCGACQANSLVKT